MEAKVGGVVWLAIGAAVLGYYHVTGRKTDLSGESDVGADKIPAAGQKGGQ